ncbi:hypothetical protein BH09MYX1_BH09MYX1_07310 [soil metagenome]
MWELALVFAASALGCLAVAYFVRIAPKSAAPLAPSEGLRDDVQLALGVAACAFLLAVLRGTAHPFDRGSLRLGGFLAASIACGALTTIVARELRRRNAPRSDNAPLAAFAPAALAHPLLSSLLLGLLVAIASLTSRSLGDPTHLAPAVLPLVVCFALGALVPSFGKADSESRGDGIIALETCAAMTVSVHFFERDASLLGVTSLRASALSLALVPLVLRSLFAATTLAASFAFRRREGEPVGRALTRALYVGVVLATIALAGASFALLGALALPCLFAGAAGAFATVVAYELASRRPGATTTAGSLAIAAVAAVASIKLLSLTEARHGALFGVGFAALGARGAAGLLDVVARAPLGTANAANGALDDVERERADAARLPAEALGVLLIPLAVGAAAMVASCTRWAAAGTLPDGDVAELLTQCELAGASGMPATILDPAPLAAALLGFGLAALRPPSHFGTRAAGILVAAVGVALAAIIGHVLGAGAQGALAACALGGGIAAVARKNSCGSGVVLGAMALAFAPMLG